MSTSAQLFERLRTALPMLRAPWAGSGRQAGVLVALTDEENPRVLLGRRALHLPLHPGEIAFPGGKREVHDAGPWDTALREAFEEVACPPEAVCPLGELPPLLTRSGYTIHPCVASIPASLTLRADPGEVAELILPRLDCFTNAAGWHVRYMNEPTSGQALPVPHFRLPHDTVWGTSARALLLLVNLGLQAELDVSTFKENLE